MRSRIVWMKLIVVGALLVGVSSTAAAQSFSYGGPSPWNPARFNVQEVQLETARMLLSGYHEVPSHKDLEAAFPGTARALMMQIATDKQAFELHRQRAVAALGYWPDMAVYGLYSQLLHASDTGDAMRHQVIGHMARVFGELGLAEVVPFLAHEDVQYRLTAVHVLGLLDSDAAQKHLTAALEREENEVVLERLKQMTMQVR